MWDFSSEKCFRLKYTLFDNPIEVELLKADFNDVEILIDEKITIKLRASLKLLKEYFLRKFKIPISILYENDVLGMNIITIDKYINLLMNNKTIIFCRRV